MRDWPRMFFYQLVKVVGLMMGVLEGISDHPDPVVLTVAAGLMSCTQAVETFFDRSPDSPIMLTKTERKKINAAPIPVTLSRMEEVYRDHGLYRSPDYGLADNEPLPGVNWPKFESDMIAAIIADKKNKPVVKSSSSMPAEKLAMQRPIKEKPKIKPTILVPDCYCFTPIHNEVMSVVYCGEPHVACAHCGRILSLHDKGAIVYDERIARWAQSVREEMFMVDQSEKPIYGPSHMRLVRRKW